MARVTVEDCLKRIPNRFFLVHAATKRVRQLREGSERLIDAPDNEDIVTALREIAAGKVFMAGDFRESGGSGAEESVFAETPEKEADTAEGASGEVSGGISHDVSHDVSGDVSNDVSGEASAEETSAGETSGEVPGDPSGDTDADPSGDAAGDSPGDAGRTDEPKISE